MQTRRPLLSMLVAVVVGCGGDSAPDRQGGSGSGGGAGMGGMGGGSQRGCTAIGCNTGVEIMFVPPLTVPGIYGVEVDIDGVQTRCDAALPLPPNLNDACRSMEVGLYLSGGAGPPSGHSLPGMHLFSTAAQQVTIVIWRDGTEIVRAMFSPAYSSTYPNGRECDINPCISASAMVPTS